MKLSTWNLGDGPDDHKAHGLDRLFDAGASVIGLQECGDRHKMLDRWCRRNDWRMFRGDGTPGALSVPILWNPDTTHELTTGTREATPATHVGPLGAGPSTMKPKVWNRIRFAGGLLVINGHIVPSVYLPRRRALARKHIAVLADMVEARAEGVEDDRVDVVAVGDFNMIPAEPLTGPLRRLGMKQRTDKPTHGLRTIDHIWTLGVTGHTVVLRMPGDHKAVLFAIKEE